MKIDLKHFKKNGRSQKQLFQEILLRTLLILVVLGLCFYVGVKLSDQIGENYLKSHFYFDIDPNSPQTMTVIPSTRHVATLDLYGKRTDNYLEITLSGGDVYKVEFLEEDESDFVLISTIGREDERYLYFIPDHISKKGYSKIRISPIKGNEEYWLKDITTHTDANLDEFLDHKIIDFDIKKMEIEIGNEEISKLENKRKEALRLGILLTEEEDFVPATIAADGKQDEIELRLKGDWVEHLQGEKLSFRIKLKDEALWGMRKFSIQRPETRNGVAEYLVHAFYREQGGTALRYEFVDVLINGEYLGVYALEEFFDKQLIENSLRREGPIIKPNEDHLWERWAYYLESYAPYLNFIEFDVFGINRTLNDELLSEYAQYAITLLNKFTDEEIEAEDVFDLDLYAKYLATLDVFSACHGNTWHNMRYYYNPLTARLEPIPFDEEPLYGLCRSSSKKNDVLINPLFENEEFTMLYVGYMDQFLDHYDDFIRNEQGNLDQIAYIFGRDGVPYQDFGSILGGQHQYMRNSLYEDTSTFYGEQISDNQIVLTMRKNGFLNNDLQEISYDGVPLEIDTSNYVDQLKIDVSDLDVERVDINKFEVTYRTLYDSQTHSQNVKENRVETSFYAAGHVYGSPSKANTPEQDEVHPPFVTALADIANDQEIDFGILTGDTVFLPSENSFENLVDTMAKTGKPYFITPGNHDMNGSGLFESYFGQPFQTFKENNSLFILVSPGQDWALSDTQIAFLENTLEEDIWDVSNTFVFTHQMFWLEKDGSRFPGVTPNSWANKENESNFWGRIMPLFSNYAGDVYFIAGDVGAFPDQNSVVYERDGNLHFIASGMGGEVRDNYLVADIYSDSSVRFDLIALNGDNPNALGLLTDW
jgi:hypothetical protein